MLKSPLTNKDILDPAKKIINKSYNILEESPKMVPKVDRNLKVCIFVISLILNIFNIKKQKL